MREGIDFMSLNVNMSTAWRLVFSEFGHTALGVLYLAHQMIYAEKGYYLEWNEKKAMLLTIGGNGLTAEEATKMIKTAVAYGVFDQEQFEQNQVLTSQEIQNHYFQVVRRRKTSGRQWKYLIQENDENADDEKPKLELTESLPQQEFTNEKNPLPGTTNKKDEVTLPENLDSELDNIAPLGEDFSILPPSSEVEVQEIAVITPVETDPKEVFLAYQKYCTDLEKAHSYTTDREDACKELLKKYSLKQICLAFKAMNSNPWNRGENKNQWLAGIDYCLNPLKVSAYLGKAAYEQASNKYRSKGIPEHTKKAFEEAKIYAELVE
jgi:hypothetical protein